jgi:hypothetical protein
MDSIGRIVLSDGKESGRGSGMRRRRSDGDGGRRAAAPHVRLTELMLSFQVPSDETFWLQQKV